MKRLVRWPIPTLSIVGILLLGLMLGGTAQAQESRFRSTPLERTLVQQDSNHVNVLGQNGNEGHYRGQTMDSGVQFAGCGVAEFHPRDQYDRLDIVLSNEDRNQDSYVTINDKSDPANPRLLFQRDLVPLAQVRTGVGMRGIQFLTVEVTPGPAWMGCPSIDVQGTLTKGPAPMTQIVPRFPTGNAGVSAGSKVLFAWQPFPRATNYAIHIWLVGLSGSAVLTPTTPFSFSGSVYHKTSYTWNDRGFPPGTYQYSLLPLDDGGHNLAGWSTPVQFTIAS
jgi:hypothetical protein